MPAVLGLYTAVCGYSFPVLGAATACQHTFFFFDWKYLLRLIILSCLRTTLLRIRLRGGSAGCCLPLCSVRLVCTTAATARGCLFQVKPAITYTTRESKQRWLVRQNRCCSCTRVCSVVREVLHFYVASRHSAAEESRKRKLSNTAVLTVLSV